MQLNARLLRLSLAWSHRFRIIAIRKFALIFGGREVASVGPSSRRRDRFRLGWPFPSAVRVYKLFASFAARNANIF